MKKVLFVLVLLFQLGLGTTQAQLKDCEKVSTFSADDESYDFTYEYNLVDVYLKGGEHYEFVYEFHFEHVKGGCSTIEYRLKYQRGYRGKMPEVMEHGAVAADNGKNPETLLYQMFFDMEKKGVVTKVTIRYNVRPTHG